MTTDVPGCRAVVRPGSNGLVVSPRDSGALATALDEPLGDLDLSPRFGAQSRLRAEAELGNERVFSRVLGVYRELLDRH